MKRNPHEIEPQVVPLWPDAGRALGMCRGTTYKKAAMGEIPTLPFSGKKMVSKKVLDRLINGEAAA
jgi:hypothetical protein